jgi:hypothetical protein
MRPEKIMFFKNPKAKKKQSKYMRKFFNRLSAQNAKLFYFVQASKGHGAQFFFVCKNVEKCIPIERDALIQMRHALLAFIHHPSNP